MITIEIISIGNEILNGDVQDTNTHWLCRRLTHLGGLVRRAVNVRDEPPAIAAELHGALDRGTDLIFTTGGLGPTDDDRTLASVAQALGRPLRLDPIALDMVRRRYDELYARGIVSQGGVTETRRKMAMLPQGGVPLWNPVGGAPGVRLDVGTSTIIALPGVPKEMTGIFESSLLPWLRERLGPMFHLERVLIVHDVDDSVLAPFLKTVADDHREVYIKSHAAAFGATKVIRVTFSMTGTERVVVEQQIEVAIHALMAALAAAGIRSEPEYNPPAGGPPAGG